ncbi:MAG: hypothetical protein WAL20_01165, partial [Rhodomicrobium sp.]
LRDRTKRPAQGVPKQVATTFLLPSLRLSVTGKKHSACKQIFIGKVTLAFRNIFHKFCNCSPPGGHRALGITVAAILTDL